MKRGTRDSMEKARWLRFRLRSLVNLKKKKKKKKNIKKKKKKKKKKSRKNVQMPRWNKFAFKSLYVTGVLHASV